MSEIDDKATNSSSVPKINFGGIIKNSQIFRCSAAEFSDPADPSKDTFEDLPVFQREIKRQGEAVRKEFKFIEHDRIIVQEKGEQYYHDKLFNKTKQWQETV